MTAVLAGADPDAPAERAAHGLGGAEPAAAGDGVDVGATPVDVPIDAGRHTIVLHNPDTGQRETRTIDVKAGRTIDMTSW